MKNKNIPQLRFPEFADCGEWEEKKLSSIAIPVKKKAKKGIQHRILTLSSEYGIISQDDYFGRQIASENTDRYIEVKENDFIYNDRITKESKYGTMRRLSKYSDGIVSPIYKCFRFNESEIPTFWEYYFSTSLHDSEYKKLANEGARGGRYNISVDKLLTSHVLTPKLGKDKNEQQKIADCLSSLDTLINAQSEKVEKLKSHKKGLLQKLFPQEGQNLPEFRFPEFKDCDEWEEKKLGYLVTLSQGLQVEVDSQYSVKKENQIRFLRIIDYLQPNEPERYIDTPESKFIVEKDDLCMIRYGSAGEVVRGHRGVIANNLFQIIITSNSIIKDYLWHFLKLESTVQFLLNGVSSTTMPAISFKIVNTLPVKFPSEDEQQKIADCLSSLDELIDKHSQKLEALKAHKKGLMQGLFPCE